MKPHRWTAPTPVERPSMIEPPQPVTRRGSGDTGGRRGSGDASNEPKPKREPRELTADELAEVAARSAAAVLVTAEENRTHKAHGRSGHHVDVHWRPPPMLPPDDAA